MAVSFHVPPLCKCQAASQPYQLWRRWACGGAEVEYCAGKKRWGIISDDVVTATPQEVLRCKTITTLRSDLILSWYLRPYLSFKKDCMPLECSLRLNILYWNKWLFLKKSINVINGILWFYNMSLRPLTCSGQRLVRPVQTAPWFYAPGLWNQWIPPQIWAHLALANQ